STDPFDQIDSIEFKVGKIATSPVLGAPIVWSSIQYDSTVNLGKMETTVEKSGNYNDVSVDRNKFLKFFNKNLDAHVPKWVTSARRWQYLVYAKQKPSEHPWDSERLKRSDILDEMLASPGHPVVGQGLWLKYLDYYKDEYRPLSGTTSISSVPSKSEWEKWVRNANGLFKTHKGLKMITCLKTGRIEQVDIIARATSNHATINHMIREAQQTIDSIQTTAITRERIFAEKMLGTAFFYGYKESGTWKDSVLDDLGHLAGVNMKPVPHVNSMMNDFLFQQKDLPKLLRDLSYMTGDSISQLVAKLTRDIPCIYAPTKHETTRVPLLSATMIDMLVLYAKDVLKQACKAYPSFRINEKKAGMAIINFEVKLRQMLQGHLILGMYNIPYQTVSNLDHGPFFYSKIGKNVVESQLWFDVLHAYQEIFKELTLGIPGLLSPDLISRYIDLVFVPGGKPSFRWGNKAGSTVTLTLDHISEFLCLARFGSLQVTIQGTGVTANWWLLMQSVLDKISGRFQIHDLKALGRRNRMVVHHA
nr:hypothetical protein [Candidatus Sigynarchaeota archaeon]